MSLDDLPQRLRDDIDNVRGDLSIPVAAVDRAISILYALSLPARNSVSFCRSDEGGCTICWPELGIFCEMDERDVVQLMLVVTPGIRKKTSIAYLLATPPSSIAARLEAEFNAVKEYSYL